MSVLLKQSQARREDEMAEKQISTPEDLAQFIERTCRVAWDEDHRTQRLTQLGADINRMLAPGITLRQLCPGGLKRFIESRVPQVQMREPSPGLHIIFPAGVEIPSDVRHLLDRPAKPLTASAGNATTVFVRYHPGFWFAFKEPLAEDKARFFDPNQPEAFIDINAAEAAPQDATEIPRELILGKSGILEPGDGARMRAAIRGFLGQFDPEMRARFVAAEERVPRAAVQTKPGEVEQSSAHRELLGGLLSLSKTDQSRIQIPLDIVIDLLRRR